MPPNDYKEATGFTKQIAEQAAEDGETVGVDSEAIATYFERYYGERSVEQGRYLTNLRHPHKGNPFEIMFKTLAQKFEMISNRTRDVFVPDDPEAKAWIEAIRQARLYTATPPWERCDLVCYVCGQSPANRATWIQTDRPHRSYQAGRREVDPIV